ncbi:amidase [Siphonobacter sp.]|uniref:amidase n=1 Tax=Siphonobacter sp. TaxID=1869184 RepID=UPI003B3BAC36
MQKKRTLLSLCLLSMGFGAFVMKAVDDRAITVSVVKEAEKLLGLDFTAAEADSMRGELLSKRQSYERMRKVELRNDVAPALYFNPLPPNFVFETQTLPFKVAPAGKIKVPNNRDELAWYSVRELAELLRTRQLTSVELTRFFLERLKKYDVHLHCVVTLTETLALQQAAQADAEIKAGKYRGLLHGIPYGAKDLLAQKGYPTTWGSAAYKDQQFAYNATVIERLEKAGAVLCAKLTLGELAMGDVWFGGKTRNPWNLNRGSSGSSAGSASAVAAGLLPFAIGSETLGSIVSPSSECGTTGLRPSFGRVPRTGAMTLSWSMDKLGPLARTVEDCAIVFNAIQGPDQNDYTIVKAPFNYDGTQTSLKGLKIGYLPTAFDRNYPTKTQDSLTLATLRSLGAELVPMQLPEYPVSDMALLLTVEGASAFDDLTTRNRDDLLVQQHKNAWPNYFRASRFVPAVEYLRANRLRTKLIAAMQEKIKGLDVYLTPAFGNPNLTLTNLTGHPCVVLPNGFRSEQGVQRPTSITFMGSLFGEAKLLQVAKAYQQATNWHRQHPKLSYNHD